MRCLILFLLLSISQSLIAQPQYYNWAMGNCVIKVSENGVEEVIETDKYLGIGSFSVSNPNGILSVMGDASAIMDYEGNVLENINGSIITRSASIVSPFDEWHVIVFMSVFRSKGSELVMYVVDTRTASIIYRKVLFDKEFRFLVAVPGADDSAAWLIIKEDRSSVFCVYKILEGYQCIQNSVYDCGFAFESFHLSEIITNNSFDKIYFKREDNNIFSVDFDDRRGVLSNTRKYNGTECTSFALSASDKYLITFKDGCINKYDVALLEADGEANIPMASLDMPRDELGSMKIGIADMISGPDGKIYGVGGSADNDGTVMVYLHCIDDWGSDGIDFIPNIVCVKASDNWVLFPRYPKIKQVPKPCPDMKPPVIRWNVR
ncbi:MAG: hypothetical protein MJZ61_08220 [Bacteroidales bacterium]|nr:hypothetical protein [Bacteroidales bacterium]